MVFRVENATSLGIGATASLYAYSGPVVTPPTGTPLETAVVQSDGSLTFTTVAADRDYIATAAGKYISFHTSPVLRPPGRIVDDESTPLVDRSQLAFVGAGVTATDDGANDRTVVTIPGGGAGGPGVFQSVDALSANPRAVTDWGAILNTAITGGTRRFIFGPYDYPFTTMIDGRQIQGIMFQGAGGWDWYDPGRTDGSSRETGHTRLIWNGTGSGFAIDFSSAATGVNGNTGPVLEDLMLLYSSASYTGKLINYKNSTMAGIKRCYFGSTTGSRTTATCALALDGVNTLDVEDCTFAADFSGAAVRGRESGGAGYTNVVRFRDCTFNSKAIINPGLDWVCDHCIFQLGGLPTNGIAITTDFTYTGDQVGLTLNDCAYWDAVGGTGKVVYAPAGNSWDFEAQGCKDRSAGAGALAKLYDFQGTGTVRIFGGAANNIVDLGDGTTVGAHKKGVVIIGVNFPSSTLNLLVNAAKGHSGVFILTGSLHDGNPLGVSDGVLTLGREILNRQDLPTIAAHSGITTVTPAITDGNDMAGVIVLTNTAGSTSPTGQIADITLANPPSGLGNSNSGLCPLVVVFPVKITGNSYAGAISGGNSAACQPYAQAAAGTQGAWQLGINVGIPASGVVAFGYRVIHL